jgi:hypothetical protein
LNEHISPPLEADNNKSAALVERLDPSIGEMSTVMGAMMTELLRRTLRGSVRQIDEELQGQVSAKLDATIAQRLPGIEQSAAEAADKTAREAATEVAVEEVKALEKRAEAALTNKAQELTGHIEETAKTVTNLTHEKASELARNIDEAERRVAANAQAEMARQVEDLLQRSRKATAGMKDRIETLEATATALGKQHEQQEQERLVAEEKFRREIFAALTEHQGRLQNELAETKQRHDALQTRLAELEKPRGLRAWLRGVRGWLFGRRKKPPT